MSRIRVIATFPKIPNGNLMKLKEAAAQALELTNDEAGALQYDWFLNDKESACVVHEEYADSASVLAHVANLGPLFDTLLEVGGGCKFAVLGNPTSELLEATAALDVSVFPSLFQGK